MRILFLTGWHAAPGGIKPTFLREHDRTAQDAYDECQPDVVVGLSRGGAVAMNIDIGETPLVLMCPGWKRWGIAKTISKRARSSFSGAIDGRPFEAYIEVNSGSQDANISFTTRRTSRSL